MSIKTKKPVKLKTGETLPAGLPATFEKDHPSVALVQGADRVYRVRAKSAFNAPSFKSLARQCDDGIVKSVGGAQVEPDGWDAEGTPSWALALGVI